MSTYLRTYDSFRREQFMYMYVPVYVCDTTYGILLSRRSMITLKRLVVVEICGAYGSLVLPGFPDMISSGLQSVST